jgi:hypothetical protein
LKLFKTVVHLASDAIKLRFLSQEQEKKIKEELKEIFEALSHDDKQILSMGLRCLGGSERKEKSKLLRGLLSLQNAGLIRAPLNISEADRISL